MVGEKFKKPKTQERCLFSDSQCGVDSLAFGLGKCVWQKFSPKSEVSGGWWGKPTVFGAR